MRLLAILPLLVLPLLTAAAQDCVRGEPEPALNPDELTDHAFTEDEDGAVETARLPNGISLRLEHRGCAHFGLKWIFTLKDEPAGDLLREAAELMGQTGPNEVWQGVVDEIRNKLTETADMGQYYPGEPIELQPGYAYVYVDAPESGGPSWTLEVNYSIVL